MLKSENCDDAKLKKNLFLVQPIRKGISKKGRLLQELLRLHGHGIRIDGDYGAATQEALDLFAKEQQVAKISEVDQTMLDRLAQPLLRAVAPLPAKATLNDTVVAYAKQHLAEHPVEVGGPNKGPWVRLYMDGNEGADWPWCAGFVTYIIRAAAKAHGVPSPIERTYSCDVMAIRAQEGRNFHKHGSVDKVPGGSVFLVRKTASDWTHTGFVSADTGSVFHTIEGNTNDEGHRDGFEACERIRNRQKLDLIVLA